MQTSASTGKRLAIKFLVPNSTVGSLIGTGGKAIKDLIDVTDARINVSSATEMFPGTSDRVVLISGNLEAVSLAQTLVWELIAIVEKAKETKDKSFTWDPKAVAETLGQGPHEEEAVMGKISIPAASSGLIIGKAGNTIRNIATESGAKLMMTSKDEALFTQERILTISGDLGQCIKCTDLVLSKLCDQEEIPAFVNRGTSYSSPLNAAFGGGGMLGGTRGGGGGQAKAQQPAFDGVADTTITLAIPNELIGNIFGKQVSHGFSF